MENLFIEKTKYTPMISFDIKTGIVEIEGKSYPENSFEFYKPLIESIELFFKDTENKEFILNMNVLYFNSSTSKVFFDLFDFLDENTSKNNIKVNWYYDEKNDSMAEVGEDYKEDFENLEFNLLIK